MERKTGWIRGLFQRKPQPNNSATQRLLTVLRFAGGGRRPPKAQDQASASELWRLAFGTYAGLIRQAPVAKGPDDYQRVRRDSIARLRVGPANRWPGSGVAGAASLGDPHHLVRQAALNALAELHPREPLEPLALALNVDFADLGRNAFDRLLALAAAGERAAELVRARSMPPTRKRAATLEQLPRLVSCRQSGTLVAGHGTVVDDLRLTVVDRLLDANDPRIALSRALKANTRNCACAPPWISSARRAAGAGRVGRYFRTAKAHRQPSVGGAGRLGARSSWQVAAKAAEAVTARLEDDP
ncbi:MAG: hypothetical protein R3F40_10370 [Candidatus Competibacteraceae bacterium]